MITLFVSLDASDRPRHPRRAGGPRRRSSGRRPRTCGSGMAARAGRASRSGCSTSSSRRAARADRDLRSARSPVGAETLANGVGLALRLLAIAMAGLLATAHDPADRPRRLPRPAAARLAALRDRGAGGVPPAAADGAGVADDRHGAPRPRRRRRPQPDRRGRPVRRTAAGAAGRCHRPGDAHGAGHGGQGIRRAALPQRRADSADAHRRLGLHRRRARARRWGRRDQRRARERGGRCSARSIGGRVPSVRMPRSEEIRFRAGDAVAGRNPHAARRQRPASRGPCWSRAGCRATATAAGTATRHPRLVRDHRSTGPAGSLRRLADALAARGVASLRYDPRGCGESPTAAGRRPTSSLASTTRATRSARCDRGASSTCGRSRSSATARGPDRDQRRDQRSGHRSRGHSSARPPARCATSCVAASPSASRSGADRQHPIVERLDRCGGGADRTCRATRGRMTLRIGGETVDAFARRLGAGHPHARAGTGDDAPSQRRHRARHPTTRGSIPTRPTLLADTLAAAGSEPAVDLVDRAPGTTSRRRATNGSARLPPRSPGRIEARELPPVLVAIEQMGDEG